MAAAKTKREGISATLRFEVFKRDAFTCQYCAAKAPDVVLHVDHIRAVSDGGGNEMLNLITACASCNLGKGARALSDTTAVAKQHAQLEELQLRREQLEMMLRWKSELIDLDAIALDRAAAMWSELLGGVTCLAFFGPAET